MEIKVGDRFGMLTVIGEVQRVTVASGNSYKKVMCMCDCGNEKMIPLKSLIAGTKSCGCFRLNQIHNVKTLHGESGGKIVGNRTQLYRCWSNIKSRCYNQKVRSYSDYGAKGIRMCDEWLNDYSAFKNWAEKNGFKPGLTIERKDPSKNYCPENCEWITLSENSIRAHQKKCWGRSLITNEYVEFENIRKFASENGFNFSAIDQVLHGHNKTHKNWVFGYL